MTIDRDTFTAGSWGDGINVTVTGIPDEAEQITFSIGSWGEFGGGAVEYATQDTVEGVTQYEQLLAPGDSVAPVAPDEDGYPGYSVSATYQLPLEEGEESRESVSIGVIDLTILEGPKVTGPATATVEELAEGVELQFSGFAPGDTLEGAIEYLNEDFDWENIGAFSSVPVDDVGNGLGELTVTGSVAVDDQFRVVVSGPESGATVTHIVQVIASEVAPEPESPADPPAKQPTKPERVETAAL